MEHATSFIISRNSGPAPEFALHERCCHDYGRVTSVRSCLQEHLAALRQRADALQAILATEDPERAERLLLDPLSVLVTEVVLKPQSERVSFDALMTRAFQHDR